MNTVANGDANERNEAALRRKQKALEILIERGDKEPKQALAEMREIVKEDPLPLGNYLFLYRQGEDAIAEAMSRNQPVAKEMIKGEFEAARRELGYDNASALERLAIDEVVISSGHMSLAHMTYGMEFMARETLVQAESREKRMTAVQKRYCRALETLAKIRRLNLRIQVNVAMDGGQQQNIQP